ncbi:MAG: VOC family protein, partial [Actinomycetes bacterium]
MTTLTTCLWFDGNAVEAVAHYLSIFPNSTDLSRSSEEPGEGQEAIAGQNDSEATHHADKETPLTISFELDGQPFMALNGGPEFPFTPAISFVINCQNQEQVDYYWERLLDGGNPEQCGWLTDKFGVSWQIVPDRLGELMSDPDPERSGRVMQ